MLEIILTIFLITGFFVGCVKGHNELKNSTIRYPDKSMFKYWLG